MAKKRKPIAVTLPLLPSPSAPPTPTGGDRHCALCHGSGLVLVVPPSPSALLRIYWARGVALTVALALVPAGGGERRACPSCVERGVEAVRGLEGWGVVQAQGQSGGRR